MNMTTIQFKKLNDKTILPSTGTPNSAGYDLYAIEDHTLMPMDRKLFKLGFSIAIPNGMYGRIAPRSGLAFKNGIDVLAGVIDSDYRNEVGVLLINFGNTETKIVSGDRIAQIIFEFYNIVNFEIVNDLSETQRSGGFGSTDVIKITSKQESKKLPTIEELYATAGGISIKERYSNEVKKQQEV